MNKPDISSLSPATIVSFIGDIFEQHGSKEYLGEPVTVAEHMLQAATFAEQGNHDETIIVAALLHDIGHFTSDLGTFSMEDTEDRLHEVAGAAVLERLFPPVITDCVRHHVAAKRYLCATRRDYFDRLSLASVHSLNLQGGPMKNAEVVEFEKNPSFREIIQVRYCDDAGKRTGMKTPPFEHFAPMVQRAVDRHRDQGAWTTPMAVD